MCNVKINKINKSCRRFCTTVYEDSHFKRLALGAWPWRSLKVIRIAAIRQVMCHFLLVICSNNVCNLHRFRDITTFTMYVTACDLEKSFSFTKTVKITGHVRCSVHVLYFPRSSKDINGNNDLQSHSRSLLLVPFDSVTGRVRVWDNNKAVRLGLGKKANIISNQPTATRQKWQ